MPFYNEIQDIGNKFILWKNPDLQSAGSIPFKDIDIEWGYDPEINRVKIKSLSYPKDNYNLEKVQKIAKKTSNCKNCIEGRELPIDLNTQKDIVKSNNNYNLFNIPKSEESMKMDIPIIGSVDIPGVGGKMGKIKVSPDTSMTKFADKFLKNPKLSQALLPQVYSELIKMGISWGIPELTIQKIIFFALGGSVLVGNEFWMPSGRLKDEIRILASNLFAAVIDPSPQQLAQMQREVQGFMNQMRFGNPLDMIKMAFQSPIENITNMVQNAIKSISFGGAANQLMMGLPGSGFVFGSNMVRNPATTPYTSNLITNQTSRFPDFVPKGNEISNIRISQSFEKK